MQTAEMSFLCRMSGLSFISGVRSSVTWEGHRVELLLLCIQTSQMSWLGHLTRMPPGRLRGEVFGARPMELGPGGAGGTMSLS